MGRPEGSIFAILAYYRFLNLASAYQTYEKLFWGVGGGAGGGGWGGSWVLNYNP